MVLFMQVNDFTQMYTVHVHVHVGLWSMLVWGLLLLLLPVDAYKYPTRW